MKQKHILVTGGTGFLGAALVKELVSHGHKVRVLDNGFRSSLKKLSAFFNDIEIIHGDIRDKETVISSLKKIDLVLHLAAVNGTEHFYTKPALVLDVGVYGILNVLEGCLQNNVPEIILASSSEVYQTPSKIPTDESEPLTIPDVLNPRYSYGGSKIISELLVFNYGRSHFQRALVFRPHNVYGPAMGGEHVIPQFISRILQSMEQPSIGPLLFPIQGDGKQTRSFIHIDDMIKAILLLIEKGVHMNIYHIGNPEEISIRDLAQKIASYFGKELKLQPSSLTLGSTERRCPNIDKMKKLGFNPTISLMEGLPSTIEWYATHLLQNVSLENI